MDESTTRALLKNAVDTGDFATFNQEYIRFLKHFDAFNAAYSPTPTPVHAVSAIFGCAGFYLAQTTDEQADTLLAHGASAQQVFGKLSIEDRLKFLSLLKSKIDHYKESITLTITADTGKPADLTETEMTKGNAWFAHAAEHAPKQLAPVKNGKSTTLYKPRGTAQIIGAYNYPFALTIGGIVGALASGNSVIVSAPLKAPNWVFPFQQAATEAIEAFAHMLKAEGNPHADAFSAHKHGLVQHSIGVNSSLTNRVDIVHFVGSDYVGNVLIRDERIAHGKSAATIIREKGGSNVVIVMASAVANEADAHTIAKTIYDGFVPATGQRCTAPRMLCVQDGAQAVSAALKAMVEKGLVPHKEIGNPFDKGIKVGPLVDTGAYHKMKEAIALAIELGATVSGHPDVSENALPQPNITTTTHWVNPVVIDWSNIEASGAKADAMYTLMKDEIFGPLLHIVRPVANITEAIAMANTLDNHGLAGAIWSRNEVEIDQYINDVKTTSIAVNEGTKDQSPDGKHGHPEEAKIGGPDHYRLYVEEKSILR